MRCARMKKWEWELARARVMRRLIERSTMRGRLETAAEVAAGFVAERPSASPRGGSLWFAALRTWQKKRVR